MLLSHLETLRQRLGHYRVIHVACDNTRFHKRWAVEAHLAGLGGQIRLHFLPTHSPVTNPMKRVSRHLHEELTRNHRYPALREPVAAGSGPTAAAPF